MRRLLATGVLAAAVLGLVWRAPFASAKATAFPDPAIDTPLAPSSSERSVVFAGGCFWGVQAVFQRVAGTISATSGYAGGSAATANYETVSRGATGHAESVRVV